MTVYVDDARIVAQVGRLRGRWSHLTADTRTELDAFAARLGLRRGWIQYPGTPLEHYDLIDAKRELALRLDAVPITAREGGHQVLAKRAGRRFNLTAVRTAIRPAIRPDRSSSDFGPECGPDSDPDFGGVA